MVVHATSSFPPLFSVNLWSNIRLAKVAQVHVECIILKMMARRRWDRGAGEQEGKKCVFAKCKRDSHHNRRHLEQWGSATMVCFLSVPTYRRRVNVCP